ncbi:MAG: ROK family protein [Bacteroidetes bacterium]|nr:ROK family protein [Bacteroidota bacterium]
MHLINPKKNLSKIEGVVEIKNYLLRIRLIKNLYQKGASTANEICGSMGISLPTVNALLTDLIRSGEVIKQGRAASQGGRKPDLYRLAPDAFYVLAVDLTKYSASLALYNCRQSAIKEKVMHKIVLNNEPETFELLCQHIESYLEVSGFPTDKTIAIGISMPGLIDSKAGINHTYLNFGGKSLQEHLESRFLQSIFLENDARAMTLAEYKFFSTHTAQNVLGIFVGWGIGLGIIIDGKIYQGTSGFAGEFAHSPLFESQEINCICGKKGCLEAVASGTSIVRMAEEALLLDKDSIMARMVKSYKGPLDPNLVVNAAQEGDQRAITILSEVGLNLGRGISMLIQLLNPELIILGGVVAEAKQYILTPIQQALNVYSMAKSREKTQIALYQLGSEVGLRGAIAVVTDKLFEEVLTKPN